jgi:Na+/H+-dicarboxylate symporter
MNSIAPHLAVATAHTVSYLRQVSPSAASRQAAQALGGMIVVVTAAIGVFLTAATSAARSLASVLSQFVRLATAMLSGVVVIVIVILIAVALLMHRLCRRRRAAALSEELRVYRGQPSRDAARLISLAAGHSAHEP